MIIELYKDGKRVGLIELPEHLTPQEAVNASGIEHDSYAVKSQDVIVILKTALGLKTFSYNGAISKLDNYISETYKDYIVFEYEVIVQNQPNLQVVADMLYTQLYSQLKEYNITEHTNVIGELAINGKRTFLHLDISFTFNDGEITFASGYVTTLTDTLLNEIEFDIKQGKFNINPLIQLLTKAGYIEQKKNNNDIHFKKGGEILIAPNGKRSNLNSEQYKLVRIPQFKAWFGDWENDPQNASKVVDENGEPLVVYHGTINNFSVFDKKYATTNTKKVTHGYLGHFFTPSFDLAIDFTRKDWTNDKSKHKSQWYYAMNVFLNIRNPYILTARGFTMMKTSKETQLEYIANGYDGIIITKYTPEDKQTWINLFGTKGVKEFDYNQYVAFYSNQIKLADGSNTKFDSNNPDIRFDQGGEVITSNTLLAPNGKPSNLNTEQYKLVRTPEFKAWFGDWENDPQNASKVVDENGEPLVVWHGSENLFYVFEKEKIGSNTKNKNRKGFFFSSKKQVADTFILKHKKDEYGFDIKDGYNKPYFINLRNPNCLDLNKKLGQNIIWADKFIQENDSTKGFIIYNAIDTIGELSEFSTIVIVPEPNQIKLADGSNTTFDANNDDIRYADGGILESLYEKLKEHKIYKDKNSALESSFVDEQGNQIYHPNTSVKQYATPEQQNAINDFFTQWQKLTQEPEPQPIQVDEKITQSKAFKQWFNQSKVVNQDTGEPLVVYHGTNNNFDIFNISYFGKTDDGYYGIGFYFTPDIRDAATYGKKIISAYISLQNPFIIKDTSTLITDTVLEMREKLGTLKGIDKDIIPNYNLDADYYVRKIDYNNHQGRYTVYAVYPHEKLYGTKKEIYGSEFSTPKQAIVAFNQDTTGIGAKYPVDGLTNWLLQKIDRNNFHNILIENGYDGIIVTDTDDEYIREVIAYFPNQIKLADGSNTTFNSNNPDIRFEQGGEIISSNTLLAPNGKPSNLNDEQYKLVRTPEFKAWFGDWETPLLQFTKIFNDRYKAIDSLKQSGVRNLKINSDATIKVYHGTSISNEENIKAHGFNEQTYFSRSKSGQKYGDSPIDVAKRKHGSNAVVMEINVDPRYIESAAAGSELYCPYKLVNFGGYYSLDTNASKVVDENGEPLVVYHVTNHEFYTFSNKKSKDGFFFSPNKERLSAYGKTKIQLYFLNILNPSHELFKTDIKYLAGKGYDGIMDYGHGRKVNRDLYEIIAFYPNQIKLADGSNTTFHANNPDIRFNQGGEISDNITNSFILPTIKEIVIYQVTVQDESRTEYLYTGIDEQTAKKEYENATAPDEFRLPYKILEQQTNKYKFIKELDAHIEDSIEDYPINEWYENDDVWELITEGEWESVDGEKIETRKEQKYRENKEIENTLRADIEQYVKSIAKEWKYAAYLGSTFYALVPYGDVFIQVRVGDHFFSMDYVKLGNEVPWDIFEFKPENNVYKKIYGFLSINIIGEDSDYSKDKRGFIKEYKERRNNAQYPNLISYITYDVTEFGAHFNNFENDIENELNEIKLEIDSALEVGFYDSEETVYKQGGNINSSYDLEENKETYIKWKSLVNMSKSELKKFYDSDEGKSAGLSYAEAKELGISSGRESARWIMKMKDTSVEDWTPAMWKWAKKQISFISRMKGNKGELYDKDNPTKKTPKHTSLLIWGHNPLK